MPDDPQLDALKLPPHSLEAEQSVLGGLLLDNDAVDRVGDVIADADFYSEAHRLVFQHDRRARRRRQAGRRRHGVRVARVRAEARLRRRPVLSRGAGRQRADRGQHPPLRADRPRSLDPAPARGDGGRHRRRRLPSARAQREGSARPGRGQGAAHRGAGRARRAADRADRHVARGRRRPDRDALQPRRSVGRHWRADGLHRPRPDDLGPTAGRPCRRRRTAEHGQDRARAQHRRARRARGRAAGRRLLDGNGRLATRAAADRLRRSPRPAQAAHRTPRGGGLGETHDRARPVERGPDPDRRDAGAERDRSPFARAPAS